MTPGRGPLLRPVPQRRPRSSISVALDDNTYDHSTRLHTSDLRLWLRYRLSAKTSNIRQSSVSGIYRIPDLSEECVWISSVCVQHLRGGLTASFVQLFCLIARTSSMSPPIHWTACDKHCIVANHRQTIYTTIQCTGIAREKEAKYSTAV